MVGISVAMLALTIFGGLATFASFMATQIAGQALESFDILRSEPFGGFPATIF